MEHKKIWNLLNEVNDSKLEVNDSMIIPNQILMQQIKLPIF